MKRKFAAEFVKHDVPEQAAHVVIRRTESLFWHCVEQLRAGLMDLNGILISIYTQGLMDGLQLAERKRSKTENMNGDGI